MPGLAGRVHRVDLWAITAAVVSGVLYALLGANQLAIWHQASWFAQPAATPEVVGELLFNYAAINGGLVALYVFVLTLARRPLGGVGQAVVLGAPAVIMVGLLVVPPTFSVDVLSYLAHGATGLLPLGGDAYQTPPREVAALAYGHELAIRGWNPAPGTSPYGPVWTLLESAVVRSQLEVEFAIRVVKIVAVLATLGSAAIIWRILRLVHPAAAVAGTAAFLWNPVVIVELAGEGHNDGLMVFLALLSLYATLRLRPAAGIVAAAAGSLVKYLPAVFILPQVAYLWRAGVDRRLLVWRIAIGGAVALGLSLVAFLPYLGPHLLDGLLRSNAGGPWPLWWSISGLVYGALETWLPGIDPGFGRTLILGGIFAAVVVVQAVRATSPGLLIRACSTIALTYVLVVAAAYWPWYCVLPLAFLVLEPGLGPGLIVLTLTIGSRLIAPLGALPTNVPFESGLEVLTLGAILVGVAAAIWTRLGASPGAGRLTA